MSARDGAGAPPRGRPGLAQVPVSGQVLTPPGGEQCCDRQSTTCTPSPVLPWN